MPTLPIAALELSQFAGADLWTAPADAFRNFAHWSAPVAITALWQGAVVAAGLALCLRFAPRVGAAHRFAAWAAGFGALVALPFVPAFSRVFAAFRTSATGVVSASLPHSAHPLIASRALLALNDGWSLAIAALWMLVALARLGDLMVHTARLRRLWLRATPVAMNATLRAVLGSDSSKRLTKLELCTTRELDRPSVIGFFAPRILIPEWLFEKLTRHELEQVVLHEAEHLRRGDDWTNLLQKLFLAVFPLNPALAFAERRLCREREMACDEGVVRRTQAPRAYAACLAGLAERHIEHRSEALSLGARAKALALNARAKALALNAFERRPELARRVHSILVRRNAIHPLAGRALLGAVACALVVGAVGLARCPQLVAFVPSAPKTATETAKLVPEGLRGDKVIAPSDEQSRGVGFRSINAMAIMPRTIAQRIASQPTVVHASCKQASNTSILRSAINAAQSMKSAAPAMVAGNAMAAAPTQQELVVFTTYEQVQATSDGLGDKVISDYDSETSASPRPTQTGPSQTGSGQFTITRLVFRIFPAGDNRTTAVPVVAARPETMPETSAKQGAQTASQTTDKPANQSAGQPANQATNQAAPGNPDPQTSQPKAISLGNGWFVIQL